MYVRDVTKEELTHREQEAETAADVAQEHADEFLPIGNVHIDVMHNRIGCGPVAITCAVVAVCLFRRRRRLERRKAGAPT